MGRVDLPPYEAFLPAPLRARLLGESREVPGVPGLREVGAGGGLESADSLRFVCRLHERLQGPLARVLRQRVLDRKFIDERTRATVEMNRTLGVDFLDPEYETVLGQEDARGRIVMGPKTPFYCKPGYPGAPVAPLPDSLKGNHVTLFGPPDDAKLSINAMNAIHRKLRGEPPIVAEILSRSRQAPFWGADDEDSKTPLRTDLIAAGVNLKGCFDRTLEFQDPDSGRSYALQKEKLALPIKRFPGLALPCTFLFHRGDPIPLHLYDFALHLHAHWHNPEALSYYVPKLENEEEAAYIRLMIETAEELLAAGHPSYRKGAIRLFIVLENPRAIFRVNEIMDALHPYFAGASLGWHDYLASTARVFKNDPHYRIPVKADPDIVIKYIKASHDLLADVVGSRGGIKIGGMYGILPMENDLGSPSFQLTLKGFIRDVVTQMKRNLTGFWVAHPDFVRIGIALTEAWNRRSAEPALLDELVCSLLRPEHHGEILKFIQGPDIEGLRIDHPLYPRSLIVADSKESSFIPNHDPEEVRYNVFQSLQYLTDWLSGNGCVALPAQIQGIPVRVMDDLATAERSRWEVWHEIRHGRVRPEDLIRIAHEELRFIRKDLSNDKKIVQVKWDERTEKWYPIAFEIMLQLMTDPEPVEFASELLLPFTVESIRKSPDPLGTLKALTPGKYRLDAFIERLSRYFSICGTLAFAKPMAERLSPDLELGERLTRSLSLPELLEAASFHGDIGEAKKTLDAVAAREQAGVPATDSALQQHLLEKGAEYLEKFGFKFLISARGKSGTELLSALESRLLNTRDEEFETAKQELWSISLKRLRPLHEEGLSARIERIRMRHGVPGAQIALRRPSRMHASGIEALASGSIDSKGTPTSHSDLFEIASLSKTLASVFALETFQSKGVPLDTPVQTLLRRISSPFQLKSLDPQHPEWADQVTLLHLMKHHALNMHYLNGFSLETPMPDTLQLLQGLPEYGYPGVGVLFAPGSAFQYSGGGFLVLEHLMEALEGGTLPRITRKFLSDLQLSHLTFDPAPPASRRCAHGFLADGREVPGGRLQFPAFAAGALGTASDYLQFLMALGDAFQGRKSPISRTTAVTVLEDTDSSSQAFMGVNMGVGVFIAEAGPNRFAIHQGANDGFRALSLFCHSGPDEGAGFVILCNGDHPAVPFVAEVAQEILREFELSGVDLSKFRGAFDPARLPQEQIVNLGYKSLVFSAFEPDLPETIERQGADGSGAPLDPLAPLNLAAEAKVLSVTNQRFARASNLFSPYLPSFDPEAYGRQGKIMDSWESARHNPQPFDEIRFEIQKPAAVRTVIFSTAYHLGNQAPEVELWAERADGSFHPVVPRTALSGHSIARVPAMPCEEPFRIFRVRMFPDGGLTRVGMFEEDLPETRIPGPLPPIPASHKPLVPRYPLTASRILHNWRRVKKGATVDLAGSALGGRIVSASNEHYGPAVQLISPYPPIHMFDGFESARSRRPGHQEEIVVELARTAPVDRIEIDFTFFKNNNPRDLEIEGLSPAGWIPVLPRTRVKAFAGNRFGFEPETGEPLSQLRIRVIPDGGMNRLRAYSGRW